MSVDEIVRENKKVMREIFAREVPDADDPSVILGGSLNLSEELDEEGVEE
jgi:hypothetical protein